jgi:hypothetical protein
LRGACLSEEQKSNGLRRQLLAAPRIMHYIAWLRVIDHLLMKNCESVIPVEIKTLE